MPVPVALMAAGTAISILGQWSSNAAQAATEAQNSAFYEEQAQFAAEAARRAEQLAETDYTAKYGSQMSAYAAGNVDVSGSAGITIGGTIKQSIDEIWAIRRKGELDTKLARLRGQQSSERAAMLSSAGYNLTQAATTGLSAYTKSEGFGMGFPSFLYGGTPPSGGDKPAKYFPEIGSTTRNAYQGYNLGSLENK